MEFALLIDAFAPAWWSPELARDYPYARFSLVRYADEDMASPSCCDWIIPGTANLYT